jgi:hypothetical protein
VGPRLIYACANLLSYGPQEIAVLVFTQTRQMDDDFPADI